MRLNGAAFYHSYEQQQIIDSNPVTFVQTLISVDESEILGLEIEASAQVTPTLLLTASIGVLDAEVEEGVLSGQDLRVRPYP